MKTSISRITDAVATVLLLYVFAAEIRGALLGSAKVLLIPFPVLCLVFIFAIWKGNTRAKRWVGNFLIIFAVFLCLGALRYRTMFPFNVALTIAFLATGIVMSRINRKQKVQQRAAPATRAPAAGSLEG